jgi:hypothetical protein
VAIDPGRQVIYRWSGGHSTYSGNDVLHYDIKSNRFSSSYAPEVPLEWIGASSGIPGEVSFKGRPFLTSHSYKMYAFAQGFGKLVIVKSPYTYFYDPERRDFDPNPLFFDFNDTRDNVMITATPNRVVAWSRIGVFSLRNDGQGWKQIAGPLGDPGLPHRDCSTLLYESKRDRVLFIPGEGTSPGNVWALDLATDTLTSLAPAGASWILQAFPAPEFTVKRVFRDAVYVADQDVVLVPKIASSSATAFTLPAYDVAENRWYAYEFPTSEVAGLFARNTSSASTSMVYDSANGRIWVMDTQARIWILKLDKSSIRKKAAP